MRIASPLSYSSDASSTFSQLAGIAHYSEIDAVIYPRSDRPLDNPQQRLFAAIRIAYLSQPTRRRRRFVLAISRGDLTGANWFVQMYNSYTVKDPLSVYPERLNCNMYRLDVEGGAVFDPSLARSYPLYRPGRHDRCDARHFDPSMLPARGKNRLLGRLM